MSVRLPAVVALLAVTAGCGGGRIIVVADIKPMPWDEALVPPAKPTVPAEWAEGEVTAVSDDGSTLTVKITRGTVSGGEQIAVFMKPAVDAGAHYLADESRETRSTGGRITKIEGDTFQAQVIDSTRRVPVEPGDRVVIRAP